MMPIRNICVSICSISNGTLILNLLLRPSLYSLINTYLVLYLLIGLIHGCISFTTTLHILHVGGVNLDPEFILTNEQLEFSHSDDFWTCLICASSEVVYNHISTFLLTGLISAPSTRQYYTYITDPRCKRIGTQCWVFLMVAFSELILVLKFGMELFSQTQLSKMLL